MSWLTLDVSAKSSADIDGTRSEATIRAARAKAGARMMRAEAGGSSYRYRGLYRGEKQTGRRTTVDGTDAVEVTQRNAAAVLRELSSSDLVDPGRRISKSGRSVFIPIRAEPEVDLSPYGARIVKDARLAPRVRLRD